MKRVTNLGLRWEWKHSIWMIFLVTPFTLPICYFYVGIRMYREKWVLIGLLYLLLLSGVIYAVWVMDNRIEDVTVFSVPFVIITFVNGIYRLSVARKDYLLFLVEHMDSEGRKRLEAAEQQRREKKKRQRNVRQSNVLTRTEIYKRQSAKTKFALTEKEKNKRYQVINMNKANVKEIAILPAIGHILAEKIIHARNETGSFTSFEQLVHETEIKAHVFRKAKDYMAFTDEAIKPLRKQIAEKKTRKNRQEKGLPGRHIDF